MLRQYGPQRHRPKRLPNGRTLPVGTIPAGTVFRMVLSCDSGRGRLRKLIVEGWKPRRIGGYRRTDHGHERVYEDVFVARGGHLALVRCLSTGRMTTMADHIIRRWIDLDPRNVRPPIPSAIPERKRYRFLMLRGADGTVFDPFGERVG